MTAAGGFWTTGFWGRPGAFFRVPGAGSVGPKEALQAMKAGGYGWAAFDPSTGDWLAERGLCRDMGLDVVAWTRVRSIEDVAMLSTMRIGWGAHAVAPNVEIEDTRVRFLMNAVLLAMSRAGHGLVVTDGWADPIGKWSGFRKWTGAVECFPEDDLRLVDVDGCCLHASAFFHAVVPMLGAYGTRWLGRKPCLADYTQRPAEPWVVYCADDVEDWRHWGCP